MKTYKAVCLEDKVITEDERSFTLTRGSEYIISAVDNAGTVTVFTKFWISGVPLSLFGGLIPGPGDSHEHSELDNSTKKDS